MTREVLGGLVGRSASWVKALETGRLKEPRLPVLLQLAEALRVRDLADLTGHANQHVDLFTGPGHRYLPAARAAIDSLVVTTDRQAPPAEHLRARLDHARRARRDRPAGGSRRPPSPPRRAPTRPTRPRLGGAPRCPLPPGSARRPPPRSHRRRPTRRSPSRRRGT